MKRITSIIFLMVFILILTSCGKDKYPLNGVWSGIIAEHGEEIKITLAFFNDFCFLSYEVDEIISSDKIQYTYENGSGTLIFALNSVNQFIVNNNILTFTHDDISVNLNKDTTTKAAPPALKGHWEDREDWDMVFINDRSYVSRDSTTDYGIYSFNKKDGSYITMQYKAKVEFTVSGSTLNAKINDYAQTFSRLKK